MSWCRGGLAGGACEVRGNLQLPSWTESPRCGERLTGQMLEYDVTVFNTVWVVGAAPQDGLSTFDRKTSNRDAYTLEETSAARFNQGPLGLFLLFKKEDNVRVVLCGNGEGRLLIRCHVRMLPREENPHIVMGCEPFAGDVGEKRIAQDKDVLLRRGHTRMKAIGDGKVGTGGCRFG